MLYYLFSFARTREPITIAASRSIVFKPGKSLKDTL